MGPNFSPVIAFYGDRVIAMGPLGWDDHGNPDYVEELRAWIYQEGGAGADAAATEFAAAGASELLQGPGVCWMLPLRKITPTDFQADRRAFAVAIAQISNDAVPPAGPRDIGDKIGRTIWWGHPVELQESAQAIDLANDAQEYAADPAGHFDQIGGLLAPSTRQSGT